MSKPMALQRNPSRRGRRRPGPPFAREHGAFAIMFAPLLILIIAFCGLAIDMGRLYNRIVDLNGLAKAVALAAARELNGTPAGIAAAKAQARATAERLKYEYFGSGLSITWSDEALSFSSSPSKSGTWTPASSVGPSSDASALFYAKVDTGGLDQSVGKVDTLFMKVVSNSLSAIQLRDTIVAGRSAVGVTPLGICAMSTAPAAERIAVDSGGATLSELVQYGFRRGVSYDLMQLNPKGTSPARFALNPVVAPGGSGPAFDTASLGPFMCSGRMWVPRVTGGDIRISPLPSTSPLASLYTALNSRFDMYAGSPCGAIGAPPDGNIKEYAYDQTDIVKWMSPNVGRAGAFTTTARGKLETVADLPDDWPTPPSSSGDYGPLWAYGKAVKTPSPLNSPEPSGGYSPFTPSDWVALYKSGPSVSTYPPGTATPYQAISGTNNFKAPSAANKPMASRGRRVLNIPLLSCEPSVPSGATAQVLAIGKFFMTVQATQNSLVAEFSGLVPEAALPGEVELYP
jgi:Flp pilus assembly protein TadG